MKFPIFPLNGAVLFPKTTLPLNIFEERYLRMTEYSLANQRLIGMIQTKENGELFTVGCLGKIISFNETDDGRYLISLEGVNCYKIEEEIDEGHLFRMVKAKIINQETKIKEDNILTKKILNQFKIYIDNNDIKIDLKDLEQLGLFQIIKFITMISPFTNIEKQMCLEIINPNEFAEKLLSILEIYSKYSQENKTIN